MPIKETDEEILLNLQKNEVVGEDKPKNTSLMKGLDQQLNENQYQDYGFSDDQFNRGLMDY